MNFWPPLNPARYQPSHFFVSTLLYWVSLFPLQLDLIRYCCHFEHLNNGFTLEALNSQLRCSFDSPSCLLLQVESTANFSLPSIVKIERWTLEWTSIFLTKNHIRFSSNLISHKFSSPPSKNKLIELFAFCNKKKILLPLLILFSCPKGIGRIMNHHLAFVLLCKTLRRFHYILTLKKVHICYERREGLAHN